MDSPKPHKSDPAVLLLNEVDILLAQTRVIELCLKQTQATAANETARIHEEYQAELERLRSRLALFHEARPPAADQTTVGAPEQKFHDAALQNQLAERQRLLESRDAELQTAKSETTMLRDRVAELEMLHRQAQAVAQEFAINRQDLQVELAAVRQQLAKKQEDFEKQQLISRTLQAGLEEQLAQVQDRLREGQSTSQVVETELQQAIIEIATLHGQLAQLQTSHQAAQIGAQELEQTRVRLEAEIADLQIALAARDRALQEKDTTIAQIEHSLKTDIVTLRSQLEQKQELVEFRDDELRDVHGQLAALQQRILELESVNQSAAANAEEIERIRRSFEAELTVLQQQVAARDLALSERQEAASAVELALHSKVHALQQEQARDRSVIDERENELRSVGVEIAALRHRIGQLEAAAGADLTARQFAEETCRGLEAELTSLHATLAQKEYALKEQQNFFRSVEDRLGNEISQLRSELEQRQTASESNNAELERLRSQVAELQQRNDQAQLALRRLEEDRQQAGAHRLELEARLQAKEDEFRTAEANSQKQKEAALREQENRSRSVEEQLSAEINQLRAQLEEQHRISDQGNAEFERLRSEIAALQEQTTHSELSRRQLEENRQGAVALAQELEARLLGKENELRAAEANAQEEKEAALREQEILFKAVEQRLAAETNRLRTQLEKQYGLFGQGNAELERLRSEIAQFREQSEQSGHSRRELEENWRRVVASEQELRTSLLAKEDELRAVRTKGNEFKSEFEAAISQLQLQLTEKGLLAESRGGEIENLQADISRLSEQLAQRESAQTAAQDNFQKEIESIRTTYRAEIAALQEHRGNQQELDNQLARERENAADLRRQIAERERLSEEAQTALKIREHELAVAAAEAATLRAHLRELETTIQIEKAAAKTETDQALSRLETESISLRSDLQQKSWALAQQQATVENLALAHKNQIQKLEAKLAEHQHDVQERNLALERAESQGGALHRRIEELESELQHAQLTALSRAEQVAHDAGQIEELNSQLAEKTSLLQNRELEGANLSHTLRNELDRLVREAEERNQILQNRNDELVRVKAEMDSLHERFTQLESSTSRAKSALAGETERMRTELQAQLALLQAELSQKEWALEERDATARGLEQTYHEEIESLRKRLAEEEAAHKVDGNDYVLGEPRLTQAEEERFHVTDSTQSGDQHSRQAAQNRRWRNGFAWKRRWKS